MLGTLEGGGEAYKKIDEKSNVVTFNNALLPIDQIYAL